MTTGASRDMIVTNAFFMALAILSVILRFLIRRKQEVVEYAADDWLILLAMVPSTLKAEASTKSLSLGLLCSSCRHKYRRCSHRRLWNTV